MKNLKLFLLDMMLASGSVFAMEEGEASKTDAVLNQLPTALNQLSIDPQEYLLAGIEDNDPEKVRFALEAGADPNKYDNNKQCPLSKTIDKFYGRDIRKPEQQCYSILKNDHRNKHLTIANYLLHMGASNKQSVDFFVRIGFCFMSNIFIYPLLKTVYDFGVISPQEKRKESDLYKSKFLGYPVAEWKKDKAKALLLLFPDAINDEECAPHQKYLLEIQNEMRSDLLAAIQKKPGSVFNYLKHRELGIRIPKKSKKVANKSKQETNSNDNNSQ